MFISDWDRSSTLSCMSSNLLYSCVYKHCSCSVRWTKQALQNLFDLLDLWTDFSLNLHIYLFFNQDACNIKIEWKKIKQNKANQYKTKVKTERQTNKHFNFPIKTHILKGKQHPNKVCHILRHDQQFYFKHTSWRQLFEERKKNHNKHY